VHVGGRQGFGQPTGLQPEKPGGNVTPAKEEHFRHLIGRKAKFLKENQD